MIEKTNKKIELILSQTPMLINRQFRDLGNFMGDLLLLLELQTSKSGKVSNILQIRSLIDQYAEKGDHILNQQKLGLINNIDELVSLLLLDLEKINK